MPAQELQKFVAIALALAHAHTGHLQKLLPGTDGPGAHGTQGGVGEHHEGRHPGPGRQRFAQRFELGEQRLVQIPLVRRRGPCLLKTSPSPRDRG